MDLAFELFIEVVCVIVVWRTAIRQRCGATGPLFVTVAFGFHGLAELTLLMLPAPTSNSVTAGTGNLRLLASDESVRAWRLWAMVAIVVFSATYLAMRLWRARPPANPTAPSRLEYLPWYGTGVAALMLWPALLRSSQIDTSSAKEVAASGYWAVGLANQFVLVLAALAVIDFALRRSVRWLPSLAATGVACGLMLLIGQRLEVVALAVVCLGALWWFGAKPSMRMLVGTATVVLLCTVSLTLARSQVGRQTFIEGGASNRVQSLTQGANGITDSQSALMAAANMANRFDGNGFPALVLQNEQYTDWRSGAAPITIGANLSIPSFLNPAKTDSSAFERSEKEYVRAGYGFLFDWDYLPTLFGSALAMGGVPTLLLFAGVVGVGLAALDRFLRRRTVSRLVLGVCVSATILTSYEKDISALPAALRSALVFLAYIAFRTVVRQVLGRARTGQVDADAYADEATTPHGHQAITRRPRTTVQDDLVRTSASSFPLSSDLFEEDRPRIE